MHLASYIDSNISEYINNVYLKLGSNTQEKEDCLIILLNNEDLDIKKKEAIIQKVETKISTLLEIGTKEVEDLLFENSKLQPNWEDIISRFVSDENVISNPVIAFLNNIENVEFLAKIKIDKEKPDKKTVDKFLETLLLCEKINNNSYAQILKSISTLYSRSLKNTH